jgi:hypothetical protein
MLPVPKNLEPNNHPLFSSDNSRLKLMFTQVLLTKKLSLLSLSHSWSQLFSHSLRMKLRLFSDNNKMFFSFSEPSQIMIPLSRKLSKRLLMPIKEKFFSLMLELLTKFKENLLNSLELLKMIIQQLELFSQLT